MKVNFCFPKDEEIGGNLYYKDPNCKEATKNLMEKCGVTRLIEPNYGSNGMVVSLRTREELDLYDIMNINCPKCDGITVSKELLRECKYGLIARSRDCLLLMLESENFVSLLHISAESLNNGILLNIPFDCKRAVLGPCICDKHYTLEGDVLNTRTSNYKVLRYDKFCYTLPGEEKLHISIKDIVMERLKELNIEVIHNDIRCTYETEELGSLRRNSERANSLIIW